MAVAMVMVSVLAAVYIVLGAGMPMSSTDMSTMADMSETERGSSIGSVMLPATWSAGYAALIFLMWWIMMIAIMTPSAAPTVLLFAALTGKTDSGGSAPILSTVFLLGYLTVWAVFSLLATGLQWVLELRGLVSPDMMVITSALLGGSLLVGAGFYQLSPLKQVCLEHCRSPMRFLVERRRSGASGVFRMGVEHGAFCLGCCWFLMALLFVGGIMNLYWIIGLALFVAVEKLAPMGGLLSRTSGLVLVSAGVWFIWQGIV